MQPLNDIASHFIVAGKVMRPKMPYTYYSGLDLSRFEVYANQYTFATDLPSGTYKADDLQEPVWQYNNGNAPEWRINYNKVDAEKQGINFEVWADFMWTKYKCKTRLYVPGLKQSEQEKEI